MATALFLSLKPRLLFPSCSNFPPTLTSVISHHQFLNQRFIPKIPFASFRNNSSTPPPETECPVPLDQQPVNEYEALSNSFQFSWISGDLVEYCSRLSVTGASVALFVGLPVSWFGSVGPETEPLKPVLGAASLGLFVITLAVVRMYLGWAYVGNRLLSATIEYEETGWYDGQIWVKTAEVLARDRLIGSFSVIIYTAEALSNFTIGLWLQYWKSYENI